MQKRKRANTSSTKEGPHSEANGPFIGTAIQAPMWQRNNPNIKSGYRIGYNTNWLAFKSLF